MGNECCQAAETRTGKRRKSRLSAGPSSLDVETKGEYSVISKYRQLSFAERERSVAKVAQHVSNLQRQKQREFHDTFDLGMPLGKGAFGTVHLCVSKELQVPCAVKIVKKATIQAHPNRRKVCKLLTGEIATMKYLREAMHIGVAKTVGLYEDSECYQFVMELLAGQTLLTFLNKKLSMRPLKQETAVRQIIGQLLGALQHLHSLGICHRDVKLENMMLESDWHGSDMRVKLIDFGFATFFDSDETTVKYVVGTPEYMAPEVIARDTVHGAEADIWSLSVLTYLLLTRQHPFKVAGVVDKMMIKGGEPDYSLLECFSEEAKYFIKAGLTKDPKVRPTASDLLKHGWFSTSLSDSPGQVAPGEEVQPLGSSDGFTAIHSTASQSGNYQAEPAEPQQTAKERVQALLAANSQ